MKYNDCKTKEDFYKLIKTGHEVLWHPGVNYYYVGSITSAIPGNAGNIRIVTPKEIFEFYGSWTEAAKILIYWFPLN